MQKYSEFVNNLIFLKANEMLYHVAIATFFNKKTIYIVAKLRNLSFSPPWHLTLRAVVWLIFYIIMMYFLNMSGIERIIINDGPSKFKLQIYNYKDKKIKIIDHFHCAKSSINVLWQRCNPPFVVQLFNFFWAKIGYNVQLFTRI
jgi:hypothetical protein